MKIVTVGKIVRKPEQFTMKGFACFRLMALWRSLTIKWGWFNMSNI